jgi:hypothetical protein
MVEGASDIESLAIILEYVEAWSMLGVGGKKIPFDAEKGLDLLNTVDEQMVNWFIGSWFEARAKREELPKKA